MRWPPMECFGGRARHSMGNKLPQQRLSVSAIRNLRLEHDRHPQPH